MKITVLTLFPEFFDSFRSTSIIKRALEQRLVEFETVDFRAFTLDRHIMWTIHRAAADRGWCFPASQSLTV